MNSIGALEENNKTIKIKSIKEATINGLTYYYIISSDNEKFRVSIDKAEYILPFLNVGDSIKVFYRIDTVNDIVKVEE